MKKLLFILAMLLPLFAYANNDEKSSNFVEDWKIRSNPELGYIIYHEYRVNSSDITLPFVVQVPAPPTGTIVQVNGPTMPNITNWSVSNGILTITYTNMDQFDEILIGGTFYIETQVTPAPESTYPYRNYAIRLVVL